MEETPQQILKRKKLQKLREGLNKLPNQKPHLDFLAALLTIPVLITVIYLNLNAIKGKNAAVVSLTPVLSSAPSQEKVVRNIPSVIVLTSTPKSSPSPDCVKDIGPIDVAYPEEGQTVSDNPLCISINYSTGNYCSVVWAYKINGAPMSDYSNNSVCLYNLPSGDNTFTLQVKSLVSASIKTIIRHFTYNGIIPTPTPTMQVSPTSTSSATK